MTKPNRMVTITCTEDQLHLIKEAVEYLGRHCIGQHQYKPTLLEEWIDEKRRVKHGYSLTDMWKSIETRNHFDKGGEENTASVHSYKNIYKMGEYPLITIKDKDD